MTETGDDDLRYYSYPREEVVPLVPAGAESLLDVGCGAGTFGARVKAHHRGIRLYGVEPNARAAEAARATYDEVATGFFPEATPAAARDLDCIVFNDVLEHMVDPAAALHHARSMLAPGGRLIVSLPNVANSEVIRQLFRGRFDYAEVGVLDRTHLRFFTASTGRELLEQCGFRVIDESASWRIHGGLGARVAGRLSNRIRRLNYRQTLYVCSRP